MKHAALHSTPNVAPMIDVMLVLLIIFMVAMPALIQGVPARPPTALNLKAHPDDEVTELGIDVSGRYFFQKRLVTEGELMRLLRRRFASDKGDHTLYLRVDRDTEYRHVLKAMDLASASGVRVVAAIATPPNP